MWTVDDRMGNTSRIACRRCSSGSSSDMNFPTVFQMSGQTSAVVMSYCSVSLRILFKMTCNLSAISLTESFFLAGLNCLSFMIALID